MTKTLKQSDLDQFTGSEIWYKVAIAPRYLYTQGVKHVADAGGAYWLIDAIAIAQSQPRVRREEFQLWVLDAPLPAVIDDDDSMFRSGSLTCDDGNGNIVFTQRIEYTDFPLDKVTIYFENNTLYLPSER